MKKIVYSIIFILLTLTGTKAQLPQSLGADLDAYINKGLNDWQLPGLALVIVKDGQVVKLQGYGVKDIRSNAPVDANTRFFIASNSKLFTGTVLSNLEQQGKLNLNDPITKYFPNYQLYDSIITKLVSIRDMLSHRIGTKTFQGDFTFWNTTLSRSDIMQRMRLLKPSAVFRQDYGYCNSCFMTAGEIIPKVIGQSWEQYVQDSILNRLDMRNSFAASNGIELRSKNMATPYTTSYSGNLNVVPYDTWDNLGPAASIVSTAQDLSQWLLFQLDSGRHNGQRVMPWSTLARTRSINVMTGSFKSSVYPINFRGYGLGIFAADYNGHQLYWHTGGAAGMVSNVCFVPDLKLGIAILTNNDNQNFFEALRYQLLDFFLQVPPVDRSAQMLPGFQQDMKAQLTEIAAWRSRVKGQTPTLSLEKYTGTYTNELYGNITVSQNQNKQLVIHFSLHPKMTATLTYMDNNEWLLEYSNIEYGIFATKFDIKNNAVQSLQIPVNPFVEMDAYTFTKQ